MLYPRLWRVRKILVLGNDAPSLLASGNAALPQLFQWQNNDAATIKHWPEPGEPDEPGEPGELGELGEPGEPGELGELGEPGELGELGELSELGELGESGE